MNVQDKRDWLSVQEAAKILGITPRRLRKILQDRGYPVERIGRVIVLSRTVFEAIRKDREKRLGKQAPQSS